MRDSYLWEIQCTIHARWRENLLQPLPKEQWRELNIRPVGKKIKTGCVITRLSLLNGHQALRSEYSSINCTKIFYTYSKREGENGQDTGNERRLGFKKRDFRITSWGQRKWTNRNSRWLFCFVFISSFFFLLCYLHFISFFNSNSEGTGK